MNKKKELELLLHLENSVGELIKAMIQMHAEFMIIQEEMNKIKSKLRKNNLNG